LSFSIRKREKEDSSRVDRKKITYLKTEEGRLAEKKKEKKQAVVPVRRGDKRITRRRKSRPSYLTQKALLRKKETDRRKSSPTGGGGGEEPREKKSCSISSSFREKRGGRKKKDSWTGAEDYLLTYAPERVSHFEGGKREEKTPSIISAELRKGGKGKGHFGGGGRGNESHVIPEVIV